MCVYWFTSRLCTDTHTHLYTHTQTYIHIHPSAGLHTSCPNHKQTLPMGSSNYVPNWTPRIFKTPNLHSTSPVNVGITVFPRHCTDWFLSSFLQSLEVNPVGRPYYHYTVPNDVARRHCVLLHHWSMSDIGSFPNPSPPPFSHRGLRPYIQYQLSTQSLQGPRSHMQNLWHCAWSTELCVAWVWPLTSSLTHSRNFTHTGHSQDHVRVISKSSLQGGTPHVA